MGVVFRWAANMTVLMNNFNVKKYDVKKYDINKTLTQYLKKILYFTYYSATDIQILVNH